MTFSAPLIILTAMARNTGCGIDLAVDLVLIQIISAVRQGPFRGVLKFVAWFELFFVRMTVGTEGFRMADITRLLLLSSIEFMFFDPIRPVVKRCSPISVAFAALRHALDLQGMLPDGALVNSAGNQQCPGQGQHSKDKGFYVRLHHVLS
jgi:hypothetical protein